MQLCIGNAERGAWPMLRDPTIIGIRLNISSKLFELVTLNLVSGFDCRVLHTMVYCGAVRSAILATALLLVVQASHMRDWRQTDRRTWTT